MKFLTKLSPAQKLGCGFAFLVIPIAWILLLRYLGATWSEILPRFLLVVVGYDGCLAWILWQSGQPRKQRLLYLRPRDDLTALQRQVRDQRPEAAPYFPPHSSAEVTLRLPRKPPSSESPLSP
jgi:hypothetical protein